MRFIHLVPLAALASAFILPAEQVLDDLAIEDHHAHTTVEGLTEEAVSSKDELLSSFGLQFEKVSQASTHAWGELSKTAHSVLDEAFDTAGDAADKLEQASEDIQSWFDDQDEEEEEEEDDDDQDEEGHRPGKRPGRRPGKHPHRRPHHKPNETIYQLIASSKYTTKLAKLIAEYDDLVDALNSTAANFTLFAPTDKAFEKIPDHAPKPSKEQLKAILSYHVVPDVYPAGRILATHTVPTLLVGEHLGSKPEPQRLAFRLGLRGLTVNWYSRVVAINIPAVNGVIHGVDSVMNPPPSVISIIDLFPGAFSTLELGLGKTGLLEKLNTTDHAGGTLFAPNNFAFQKLGPKINAFLFSKYGAKYLKALLEYHIVPDITLYSDAIYKAKSSDVSALENLPIKGRFHIDLPTLLKNRALSIDIARFAGFIRMKINSFSSVAVQDNLAADGVIHVVRNVLIPPKKIGGAKARLEQWDGSELTVEDLKERLEPFVARYDL